MKILIIGRTSTGKDSLKDILTENYGWNFVKSMATRPPRTPDEDTHIFLTPEEAEKIPWENKAAWTQIGEYQYFATKQQIYDADAYIIDPKGAEMLLRNMPNEWFRIVYMKPADPETQMEMAIKRSDTPEKEIEVFNKRVQAEDDQFSEFEEHLANQDFNYPNCNMYIEFSNTYKKKDLEEFAIELEMSRRFDRNIRPIIEALMEADVMNHTENNEPIFITQDGHQVVLSIDLMVEYLEQNDDMLGDLVHRWLQLRDVDIQSLLAASAVPSDEEDIIE
jgi:guanylate kinase